MRRSTGQADGQHHRVQQPAQQQHQPAHAVPEALPNGRDQVTNGGEPRKNMGQHGATG